MYDRAPRVLTQPTTGTTTEVGPGSYEPDKVKRNLSRQKDGYAPFLSMSLRESFLTIKDEFLIDAPGPGAYNPSVFDYTKGASTLANKEQRFYEKPHETPGPGSYDLSKTSDWLKNKQKLPMQVLPNKEIIKNKLHYHRKYDPPSIPSPGQAFGFEEGSDGILQKQKTPDRDVSLGPAFYKINYDETHAVKKYRGIHFGKLTSKRETKAIEGLSEETPGPGQYDPYKPTPKTPFDLMMEERKRNPIESKLPRYHEIVTLYENKKAVPGPGHYEIKSQFEPERVNTDALLRPSFGAQTKRFLSTTDLSPAPGSYDDPRHALESCNRISGLKKSPFGQTSIRFAKDHHVTRTPGPGTYNYLDLSTLLKKKAVISSATKGGFGSTANRTAPLNKKDEEWLPGPSHYVIKSSEMPRVSKKQAVFESSSNRFQRHSYSNAAPPPGSYEVAKSYDKTQGKVLYNGNVIKKNRKLNGGFLSSTKRFSQPRDIVVRKTETENPGPGHYIVKNPILPGGNLVTKEERFKTLKSDVPGPGTYQLSPLIQHSVLKSTFNATLNNPVALALDEMTDDKTPYLPFSITA